MQHLNAAFPEEPRIFDLPEELLERYAQGRKDVWAVAYRFTTTTRYLNASKTIVVKGKGTTPAIPFYHDGEYCIVLFIKKTAVAILAFYKLPRLVPPQVLVCQIQARGGEKTRLRRIRWEKLLLHATCDYLFTNTRVTKVRVLASESNRWTPGDSPYDAGEHLEYKERMRNRMKMHYDVTAKRLGFVKTGRRAKPFSHKGSEFTRDKLYNYFVMTRQRYTAKWGL